MDLDQLIQQIRELRTSALEQEGKLSAELAQLHELFRYSGRNLAHYLAIRQQDLRELQRELASLGLSSLGRLEKCVIPSLDAVEQALQSLQQRARQGVEPLPSPDPSSGAVLRIDWEKPEAELERNASALLGPAPRAHETRVMVTLPLDANASLLEELIAGGASVLRINCAKGDRGTWAALIQRVRSAERKLGKSCRILCDLAGPNPRTCAMRDGDEEVLARVSIGEHFLIARDRELAPKKSKKLAVLAINLPQVIDDLKPGERVFYDSGALIGVVRDIEPLGARVDVSFTRKPELKIKAEKTLNFPDTALSLPSLTEQDLENLDFVAEQADMVGLSFIRSPDDVERLQRELRSRTQRELGIVLKIETSQAFSQLPRLLLTAMRYPRIGVMVARGDMAVELGFVRLAEAQEEILWLCEAALVPVIWATQVLENLNKTGVPSRAEVTDAAMSSRAECVMLNRGEHVREALRFLLDVLERMQEHQDKKRSMLRRLRVSTLD